MPTNIVKPLQWYDYNRDDPSADGLVGLWPMWDGKGSPIVQDIVNGNDGTLNGPTWVAGPNGPVLGVTGSSFVDLGFDPTIHGITGAMSIGIWHRGESSTASALSAMGTEGGSGNRGFSIGPNNAGAMFFSIASSSTDVNLISSATSVSTEWEFWVGTFTPSVSQLLYKNGNLVASDFTSIAASQYVDSNESVKIGQRGDDVASFTGEIGQAFIYNRVLTPNVITKLFAKAYELFTPTSQTIAPVAAPVGFAGVSTILGGGILSC